MISNTPLPIPAAHPAGELSSDIAKILMDLASGIAAEIRTDGKILSISDSSAQLLEYPRQLLLGSSIQELVHPDDVEPVQLCLIDAALGLPAEVTVRMMHSLSDWIWVHLRIRISSEDADQAPRFAVWGHDITQIKSGQAQLRDLALRDPLTHLGNRALFSERIGDAIQRGVPFAVILLDLDGFKRINDSLGHMVGDDLLKLAARRLTDMLCSDDMVARMGGDEFVILLTGDIGERTPQRVAARILHSMTRPFKVQGGALHVTASVGVALYPNHGTTEEVLLKHADLAMYKAKAKGKNTMMVFTSAMANEQAHTLSMEKGIYEGMRNGEFCLYYQPVCDAVSSAVHGVEALMRWQCGDRMISPTEFIPIAEQLPVIDLLGEWALRTACTQLAQWDELGIKLQYMSVNVSPRQFMSIGFLDVVQRALADAGIPGHRLMLEITETTLAQDPERVAGILQQLRAMNVQLAIDDFGTGYSNLTHLKNFPLTVLKIDRSFIHDMNETICDQRIVSAVLGLARELDLLAIAEGVETEVHRTMLLDKGCPAIQGYLLAKPMPPEDLVDCIANGTLALER